MKHQSIPELDRKGLREFGIVTGAIVAGLFGLFLPWLLELPYPLWPWIVFAVLASWSLVAPASLRPVYRAWMRFGYVMGRIMTPVVLGLLFYVVFTPMARIRGLFGKDSMARRLDPDADSYRVISKTPPTKNLERPF